MTEFGNCPFCKPERILLQNENAQVILSNPRKVPGHFLVIPKRHLEKPWELEPQELQDVFALIFEVEQKIIGKLGDGCDIRQNYRPFLKQSQLKVDHMHFHIIPRALEDYIHTVSERFESELFAELDDAEHDEVAKLLTWYYVDVNTVVFGAQASATGRAKLACKVPPKTTVFTSVTMVVYEQLLHHLFNPVC